VRAGYGVSSAASAASRYPSFEQPLQCIQGYLGCAAESSELCSDRYVGSQWVLEISLSDAIALALENNLDLQSRDITSPSRGLMSSERRLGRLSAALILVLSRTHPVVASVALVRVQVAPVLAEQRVVLAALVLAQVVLFRRRLAQDDCIILRSRSFGSVWCRAQHNAVIESEHLRCSVVETEYDQWLTSISTGVSNRNNLFCQVFQRSRDVK